MKWIKRIVIGIIGITFVASLGLIAWGRDAYPPLAPAWEALRSDSQVVVTQHADFITFEPADAHPVTGFILYPGGRVDYRVYAPVLRQIAAQGFFVAVVKVPINFAFLDTDAAAAVIAQAPHIEQWAVGGHSLGGVAAASYASAHLDELAGLVLWASYPADDSLTNATIEVLSLYGTNDMAGMEVFDRSRAQLPADAQFLSIPGGNHAQFGAYGPQAGDNPADISAEEQWAQISTATSQFLESLREQ
jgi:predicted esterase